MHVDHFVFYGGVCLWERDTVVRMYAPTYAPHAATCCDGLAPTISGVRLHVDLELDITEHTDVVSYPWHSYDTPLPHQLYRTNVEDMQLPPARDCKTLRSQA